MHRGGAKSVLGDYRGAIQDFTKAIELDPTNANYYMSRGVAKIISQDKNGGCLDLSKSGELGFEMAYDFINKLCN
jgi:tetratricopeptide (TPR) repeat protein